MGTDATTPWGLELVQELQRCFSSGDRDGVAALLHPEFRVQQPASFPHGGWHEGLDGMAQMSAEFAEHWDRTISAPQLFACGELVLQTTTQTWTAKRTGRSATVDVVELFSFADDKIASIRVFQQDTHALMQTMENDRT